MTVWKKNELAGSYHLSPELQTKKFIQVLGVLLWRANSQVATQQLSSPLNSQPRDHPQKALFNYNNRIELHDGCAREK